MSYLYEQGRRGRYLEVTVRSRRAEVHSTVVVAGTTNPVGWKDPDRFEPSPEG
jgi:hypothetical protein